LYERQTRYGEGQATKEVLKLSCWPYEHADEQIENENTADSRNRKGAWRQQWAHSHKLGCKVDEEEWEIEN
jgi:hypothetical protein